MPFTPEDVLQFLEPIMLETGSVRLPEIAQQTRQRGRWDSVARQQLVTGLLLGQLGSRQLVIDPFEQGKHLLLGQPWFFNQPAQERRQPVLRTALAGEVAHALQLAKVGNFVVYRTPVRAIALAAVVERTQPQCAFVFLTQTHPLDHPAIELEAHLPQTLHECLGFGCTGLIDEHGKAGVQVTVVEPRSDIIQAGPVPVDAVRMHQQQAKADDGLVASPLIFFGIRG
ncbi:hypothetical protein D3C79_577500 [compost metagenome]